MEDSWRLNSTLPKKLWIGTKVIRRYAETHPAPLGTDEHYLLNACLVAKYRVLRVRSAAPGAGIDCSDGAAPLPPPEPAQSVAERGRFMETSFSPTRADVQRYLKLRAATDKLALNIVRHVPEKAHLEIGEALGLLHDGIVVMEGEKTSKILADCCLHDWYDEDGMTVIERYAETHLVRPGTDEHYVLNALLHAQYRVLKVGSLVPGSGAHCEDMLSQEDLFIMDVGMSRNPGGFVLATRTLPLGEYWMTGGTGLPIVEPETIKQAQRRFQERAGPGALLFPADLALAIVRACLDAGADERIRYEYAKPGVRLPRHIPRRNRHRV